MGRNNKQQDIETSSIDDVEEHIEQQQQEDATLAFGKPEPKQRGSEAALLRQKKKRVMTKEQLEHLQRCRELAKQKKQQLAEANPKSRLNKQMKHKEVLEQAKEIDQLVDQKIEQQKKALPQDFIIKDAKYYKEKYNRLKSEYRNFQTTQTQPTPSMRSQIKTESDNNLRQQLERERLRLSAMNLFGHSNFL